MPSFNGVFQAFSLASRVFGAAEVVHPDRRSPLADHYTNNPKVLLHFPIRQAHFPSSG